MPTGAGARMGAALMLVGLTACLEAGAGYVEIKAFPGFTVPLYLDQVRLGELKNGSTVVRQEVGRTNLQLERNGHFFSVCEFDVRKNRIVTITLTILDRVPRCEIKN